MAGSRTSALADDAIIASETSAPARTYCACANAVRLHAGMNPDFFKDTVCEQAAKQILKDLG